MVKQFLVCSSDESISRSFGFFVEVSTEADAVSIAPVAREAGVSNATIHNRYPEIAERVRALHARTSRDRPKAIPDPAEVLHKKLQQARKEIDQLKRDLTRSQSINLRLTKKNE